MSQYSPLRLHVPEPHGRPGQETDYSYLHVSVILTMTARMSSLPP